jgi:hypothetical protein
MGQRTDKDWLVRAIVDRWWRLRRESVDESAAERIAFDEYCAAGGLLWPELYEDVLRAAAPEMRRSHGVYYTPGAVVGAQVRLVDGLLKSELGCAAGFADPRVGVVDPATGGGAYPLAVLDHVGPRAASAVRGRMHLFEALPGAAVVARARGLPVVEHDALSAALALEYPIVVCLGNPPYRRGNRASAPVGSVDDFTSGVQGTHLKNLYNGYVFFWRWALRVAFELRAGPAIVCFVTAGSYLRGPAFGGLRRAFRRLLDDLWVIDLGGDQLAARPSENVFPIRTPVAIAVGLRRGPARPDQSARIRCAHIDGPRQQKLEALEAIGTARDLVWREAERSWHAALTPPHRTRYMTWPGLTELFPWQLSGAQVKRTWPIGPTPQVLRARWRRLLELEPAARARAFGPTRDRDLNSAPPDLLAPTGPRPRPLLETPQDAPCIEPVQYAYRCFDRQWILPDSRLGDFLRPALWRVAADDQIFLTSMLTNVLGAGPAAVATACVPDLDHFRGSFGARSVVPLWRDPAEHVPNVAAELLARLSERYGFEVQPRALMTYCYGLLATRAYERRFHDELRSPGPRVPLTRAPELFRRGSALGEQLLTIHTYRAVEAGAARCAGPDQGGYPSSWAYDPDRETLVVGQQCFTPVGPEVWAYSVSGYRVLPSWIRRRLVARGRSELDAIQPAAWSTALTHELLELIWLLERTLAIEPAQDRVLAEVASGGCIEREALTQPRMGNRVASVKPAGITGLPQN